ncbi:MAG TPA: SRPBCC family protein [Nitrospiraceae bacterium]
MKSEGIEELINNNAAGRAAPFGREEDMTTIETSIMVNVPVRTAYNQWTQFEEFPTFMDGVTEVTKLDANRSHWKVQIVGKSKEWEAEVIEQTPNERIVWRSRTGAINKGSVTFQRLTNMKSRILLRLSYTPDGVVEDLGDRWGAVSSRVHGDLERFKEFIEKRGRGIKASETGSE